MMNFNRIDEIITNALFEDMPYGDITAEAIVYEDHVSSATLMAKSQGVLCGLDVFERVFTLLGDVDVVCLKKDGERIEPGDCIARLEGSTRNMLAGERTALNILQRMSGIATHTRKAVDQVAHSRCVIVDTRKTSPGLRILEKMAVRCGGGRNHRNGLSDGILIKDNHIKAAGSVAEAIKRARNNASFVHRIEVEVENLDMVKEALEVDADILLLDNMSLDEMSDAVRLVHGKALTEASGNMTWDQVAAVAKTGVDFISMGSITYGSGVVDLSLKFV